MSKQHNSMKAFAPALGLIFGAGVGLIIAIIASWNIAIGLAFGGAVGLIIGAVHIAAKNKHN